MVKEKYMSGKGVGEVMSARWICERVEVRWCRIWGRVSGAVERI